MECGLYVIFLLAGIYGSSVENELAHEGEKGVDMLDEYVRCSVSEL